jgi:hypothetical protein
MTENVYSIYICNNCKDKFTLKEPTITSGEPIKELLLAADQGSGKHGLEPVFIHACGERGSDIFGIANIVGIIRGEKAYDEYIGEFAEYHKVMPSCIKIDNG